MAAGAITVQVTTKPIRAISASSAPRPAWLIRRRRFEPARTHAKQQRTVASGGEVHSRRSQRGKTV
jgi:hypothetical protein